MKRAIKSATKAERSVPVKRLWGLFDLRDGRLVWKSQSGVIYGSPAGSIRPTGYYYVKISGRAYAVHRVVYAMTAGHWPSGQIDHINGDKGDNRPENLRDVSVLVNQQNRRRARSDSFSGLLGVSRRKRGTFQASIHVRGKRVHLGTYKTAADAHAAYLRAKRVLHEGCEI